MNTSIFPTFKFLALDYIYENAIKQNVATSRMCIPFPEGVQQKENYYHDRNFLNDNYRRPWTRSSALPIYKVHHEGSKLEEWKECTNITDCLEKQSTPCSVFNRKGELSVVPSSNPDSQTDLEDLFLAAEYDSTEEEQAVSECWSITVPSNSEKSPEDYLMQDDLVFDDYIAKYSHHLPSLATLRNRMKTIPVEDPLINWKWHKNIFTVEQLFRMDTFKATEAKPNSCAEEFHLERTDVKESLRLPCPVDINCPSRSGTCIPELTKMLQFDTEIMEYSQTERQNIYSDFQLKTAVKGDFLEHHCLKRDLNPMKYENVEDTVYHKCKREVELEVPLTPPDSLYKRRMHTSHFTCAAEEISSSPPKLQIIKTQGQILESLTCMSDVYHLLLKVPRINYTLEQLSIYDLRRKMSITLEKSVYTDEDCNCQNEPGLKVASTKILEPLATNYSLINSEVAHNVENFIRINKFLLEEKENLMKPKTSFQKDQTPSASEIRSSQYIPSERTMSMSGSDVPSCEVSEDCIGNTEDRIDSDLHFLGRNNRRNLSLNVNPSLKQMHPVIATSNECHRENKDTAFSHPELISSNISDASELISNFILLRSVQEESQHDNQFMERPPLQGYPPMISSQLIMETITGTARRTTMSTDNFKSNTSDPEINVPSPAGNLLEEDLLLFVEVPPTESQCQAYIVIQASAAPILNKLKDLGMVACGNWKFGTVNFDCSRFLLRQQEKNLTDSGKTGKEHDKEVMIFKNAALFHILVTLRDLILMCSTDTALGYLYEAKELYKSALGSSLDDVCKKLEIVQFVAEKKQEVDTKIAALQTHLLQWIEQRCMDDEHLKVLIITCLDSVDLIIAVLCKIKGIKAVSLCPPPGRKCLKSKSVLDSLEKYTCIVVNNHHIGDDFPWSYISLVIEYDCTDYWVKVCQGLKIPHMTLRTCAPDTNSDSCQNAFLHMQIPYVFLSSEGLLHNPDVLQLLESRYNMTFIERNFSASIQLFGNAEQCVLITVDESTAIIMQDLEELKHERSSENLILKLVALSLQYCCCWIILYTKERMHSEYSLSGNILHNISLLYAAIISLTSKTGELEVKVVMASGVEKTTLLIRQISDHTLLSSTHAPHKWINRSWLSVLTSQAEQCLLAFPCINPMVAQLMLHRASSLKWLLSANYTQLQELFPEVPNKVLKHFSDITSLHQLSISASSPTQRDTSQSREMEKKCKGYLQQSLSVTPEHDNNIRDLYLFEKHKTEGSSFHEGLSALATNENANSIGTTRPLFYHNESSKYVNSQPYQHIKHGHTVTLFNYPESYINVEKVQVVPGTHLLGNHGEVTTSLEPSEDFRRGNIMPTSISYSKKPFKKTHSVNVFVPPINESACLTEDLFDIVFSNNGENIKQNYSSQLFHHENKDHSVTNTLKHQSLEKSHCLSNQLLDFMCPNQPMALEKDQTQHTSKESIFSNPNHDFLGNLHSYQFQRCVLPEDICTKKHISTEKEILNGTEFAQIPQVKRRKLSYEKVSGRRDGQTRLRFF